MRPYCDPNFSRKVVKKAVSFFLIVALAGFVL